METTLITPNQRKIIKKLAHPIYDAEYVEKWMSRNDLPDVNATAALAEANVEGFMAAVEAIGKMFPDIDGSEAMLSIARYEPGMEDGLECTKSHCGRFDVEDCEDCDWNNHMPYIVDSAGKHVHPGKTAHVVRANDKKYVINEDLAKAIAANIIDIFKIAGLDISRDGKNGEDDEQA